MNIKLLIDGGDMKPGPAVAQQLGPLGINIGKVISSINEATKEFKGVKVPVELLINEKTKDFSLKTFSPPTSELLKKELKLEKGSANQKMYIANASLNDIIRVAKIKYPNMLQRNFDSALKSILGTCASIGILVENANANDLVRSFKDSDKYNHQIAKQLTETSPEKRKELQEYFDKVKSEQDAKIKQQQAEEEAKKAAAAAITPAAATTTAPADAATTATTAAAPVKEEKKPEKKK